MNTALRAARKAAGKTQRQVAQESRIGERSYQQYEYETREPNVRIAIRIARVLGSSVEALFGEAPSPNKE